MASWIVCWTLGEDVWVQYLARSCSIEKYFTFTVLLSTQVLFVQRLDNAIQRISVYKTYYAISWIAIYPVGSINCPYNQGQELKMGISKFLVKTD